MKKYFLTTVILALASLFICAQTENKTFSSVRFSTIVQGGILEGEADKSYGQFQLLNGIQRNAWFYGLGVGVDYYGSKRSIPLFLDVKRDIKKGKRTPFIYADAGYNFSWLRDNEKTNSWGSTDYKAPGGLYYETGLGYKFISKNRMAFGLSAGYSFKQQKETFKRMIYIDFPQQFPQNEYDLRPDVYNYKFRRVSLKLNCWF